MSMQALSQEERWLKTVALCSTTLFRDISILQEFKQTETGGVVAQVLDEIFEAVKR